MTIAIVIVAPTDCELPCDCVGGGCWCALYLYIIYLYAVRCSMWCASLPLPRPPAARGAARAAELLQASHRSKSFNPSNSNKCRHASNYLPFFSLFRQLPLSQVQPSSWSKVHQEYIRCSPVVKGAGCTSQESTKSSMRLARAFFFLGGTPVGRRGCHMPLRAVTRRGCGAQPPPQ